MPRVLPPLSPELTEAISGARGARKDALQAVASAIRAADPSSLVRGALKVKGGRATLGREKVLLGRFRRIIVVGGGKASGLMAAEVERLLGDRVAGGVVVVPDYQRALPRLRRVRYVRSTHPVPTEKGARATARMVEAVEEATAEDLVVCLISGGGSALMPLPVEGVGVDDVAKTTRLLLNSGAEIGEVNSVRKHLSRIAGGRLVEHANGARMISLIISDVVGDDLSSVASGPTVEDPTDFERAKEVLLKHGLGGRSRRR